MDKKENDKLAKVQCPYCKHKHQYNLEEDEEHVQKVSSNVYVIWCENCGEEIPWLIK